MKGFRVVLGRFRRVAFGIEGHEQGVDPFVRRQRLKRRPDRGQRCRTHVGARGEAEEDQEGAAKNVLVGHRAPVGSGQRKRPADGGSSRCRRPVWRPSVAVGQQQGGSGSEHAQGHDQACHGSAA